MNKQSFKILHTADWHIGRTLYGKNRYEEFEAFLDWLTATIQRENIDALLMAGDVFDTGTPSNRAQALYYRFLCRAAASCCRHIVVIGGNHDSPSFLDAPKEILRAINVHVVGAMTEDPADEVIVLRDMHNIPEAIVCAVPYLRDKDIRSVEPGESITDKNRKLVEGLQKHYHDVCDLAEGQQQELGAVPLIAMGHLFAAGGKTMEGDGVRDLYVGSLAYIGKEDFPASINYFALGHLHVPQCVGGAAHIRYSGSPIPMGFGEADQEKKVVIVTFEGKNPIIQEKAIPCFQALKRFTGTLEELLEKITALKNQGSSAWLEIEYTGAEIIGDLQERLYQAVEGSLMEIRRIKHRRTVEKSLLKAHEEETLDDLNEDLVFMRCLQACDVPEEERAELIQSYQEIVQSLRETL